MIYVFRQIETARAYFRLCKLNIYFKKLFLPLDPCSHVPVTMCSILTFSETSISSNSGFWKLSSENSISWWLSMTYFHKIDWLIDWFWRSYEDMWDEPELGEWIGGVRRHGDFFLGVVPQVQPRRHVAQPNRLVPLDRISCRRERVRWTLLHVMVDLHWKITYAPTPANQNFFDFMEFMGLF